MPIRKLIRLIILIFIRVCLLRQFAILQFLLLKLCLIQNQVPISISFLIGKGKMSFPELMKSIWRNKERCCRGEKSRSQEVERSRGREVERARGQEVKRSRRKESSLTNKFEGCPKDTSAVRTPALLCSGARWSSAFFTLLFRFLLFLF